MTYSEIKSYFQFSDYKGSLNNYFTHISNKDCEIDMSDEFFKLCSNFLKNEDLGFYIELNSFFNHNHSIPEPLRALLLISASNDILMKNYFSIENSFFIIHSVASYNVIYKNIPVKITLIITLPLIY